MRLTESEHQAIREVVSELTGGACAIIFGSRIDESATGGDIDLLVESSEPEPTAGAQERKTA
jgi:predicted nucleotidyltransferase